MRKFVVLLLCCFGCSAVSANAQVARLQARDAEWKSYALPQTNFTRQIDAEKNLIFRVPADWKQENTQLVFNGPHSAKLTVRVNKVPDGYPLLDFFGAVLQQVKDQPGVAEATIARKTQLQDLEAREIFLEAPDAEGEIIRSTTWLTINGPLAVSFNLKVPIAHATEIEPFFKAVVQSVIFVSTDYPAFEALRFATIKTHAPGPIHEIESIVASLNDVSSDRAAAVTRLTSLFSSHADVAVDLLLDRRPLVRAAAVEALAKTNNSSLTPILWELVDDKEPLVAEGAARAVVNAPDLVARLLMQSMSGFNIETIARVWPFITKEKRNEVLEKIFSQTAVNDPNVHIGALTLLTGVPQQEFKLPLTRILASNSNPAIIVALQVAHLRGEALPLDALFKLVSSSDQEVSKLAVLNLGLAASVADIPRIESLISKDAASTKKAFDDEARLTVKKIRFRHELNAAKNPNESREIVVKALSDSSLADFAWRYHCEPSVAGCGTQTEFKRDFNIKPFAENLFPKKMQHYTAIANPGQTVQKFYETLHGLQMDSPRAQSNLILTMGYLRDLLARELSAPPDAETLIEYTGIDPNSPIALGVWTADGALDSTSSAKRKAIVLRVKDRARFERAVERYQRTAGNFTDLADSVAIATRAIAALPAFIPFTAQAAADADPFKPKTRPLLDYHYIAEKEWNGLRIKSIEHVWISSSWQITGAAVHMAFIGDSVVLTHDLATIRDLLTNANSRASLADNPEFRKAIESRGDVVYFSDLTAVMADAVTTTKPSSYKAAERGALNISDSSWENAHHLTFDESDWSKPLLPFDPKQLSAPRDLLPASTIAYYLMNVDLPGVWSTKAKDFFGATDMEKISNVWALDLNREVFPELGPECGAVVLELPDLKTVRGGTFALFCKLKSTKLADALKAGKLFRGVGPVNDVTELKVSDLPFFVTTRNGFLVASNRREGLAAFDGKTNLAATRDYSRAVAKVPNGIVAFGGYNLEAAVTVASKTVPDGQSAEGAKLLFSLASAFHSQNFYATATASTIEGRSSVAMDREGRYPVADLSYLPRGTNITFVTVPAGGLPITDQNRLSSLVLRVRAKSPGPIDNIKDDIKTQEQTVEQKAANELLLTIAARRETPEKRVELPVKDPSFDPYLKATAEFPAADKQVMDQAQQIAGNDRDAWSVAGKLADWTHKNLEWKQVVSASATQTLATREADCSEFSQLFVAMARSLGLPARMVSGLAYSGNSFGGHAWVEVWVGKWIELDPTWGTAFVDATHIRNTSNALVMSAALNLIDLEVVETKRTVADFQKSARGLTEHLLKAIPTGDRPQIEAAIDLAKLTDEFMGAGTWASMNDRERDQMSSVYRYILREIITGYGKNDESTSNSMRLLHLEEKGDKAEAICVLAPADLLLKLRLVRRNELWYLMEVLQADSAFHVVSEMLQPVIATRERNHTGTRISDFVRVLLLLDSNAPKAIEVADAALKVKTGDKGLRLLKALALLSLENRHDEGVKLLRELSAEDFAPALYKLAEILSGSEDKKENEEAVVLYERYTLLEPHDARGFRDLAPAYDQLEHCDKAETAYRRAIDLDPDNTDLYLNLIDYLVVHERVADVRPVLDAGEKHKAEDEDLFGLAVQNRYVEDEPDRAAKLAASEPLRMKTSFLANLTMARINSDKGRFVVALRLFETAAQLDKKSPYPHIGMATVYRKQFRWTLALQAAQRGIDLDESESEGHYQLACALARLGRTKEALEALAKSVELDPDQAEWMVDEKDLKALSRLPGFKKLIPEPAKQ